MPSKSIKMIAEVIGANYKGALVAIVEPVPKYTLIGNRPQKPAKLAANLMIDLLIRITPGSEGSMKISMAWWDNYCPEGDSLEESL